MSSTLTFASVSAATPEGRPLFRDLTFTIGAERIGLVGRNGSGKSTLLRIAAGEIPAASGLVSRTGTVGMLRQQWCPNETVIAALGVAAGFERLVRIEAGEGSAADFEAAEWDLPANVEQALAKVGLEGLDLTRPMGSLSGGEQTRIGIAQLEISSPDLLLLDEPTNNLDLAGREAIAELVRKWRGGLLMASHDRGLLENVDRIVELNSIEVSIVSGGWSAYAAIRDAERASAEADRTRAESVVRATRTAAQAMKEAKDRRDRAGRAFAAKKSEPKILLGAQAERAEKSGGSLRLLNDRKMEEATRVLEHARSRIEVLTPLTIELPRTRLPAQTEVLAMDSAAADFADRHFGPWTLEIRGPERVAVAGSNGAGKTTLLRLAVGELEQSAGQVRRTYRTAMLDQHVALLDRGDTILGNLRRLHSELTDETAYAACARFAFRNRDAQRLVGTLSGGELLRAGLAAAFSGPLPPLLLVLDEPTNHLDVPSVEVLEQALVSFDGALLVVSHDRRFLQAIGVTRSFDVAR